MTFIVQVHKDFVLKGALYVNLFLTCQEYFYIRG